MKVTEATQYSKFMDLFLKNIFTEENPLLLDWPAWGQEPPDAAKKTEESEVNMLYTATFSLQIPGAQLRSSCVF